MKTSDLIALAKKYKDQSTKAKRLGEDAKVFSTRVIEELKRRDEKAVESGGVRVNMVEGETVEYDYEEACRVLARKPKTLEKITKKSIDRDALSELIQSGKISAETVAKFSTVTTKAPYILVTYVK